MSLPVVAADGSVVGAAEVTYSLDEVQAILESSERDLAAGGGRGGSRRRPGRFPAGDVGRAAGRPGCPGGAGAGQPPPDAACRSARSPPTRSRAPLPEPRGSTDEIRALVQAFNSLADQLRVHEQARREFASDVSHELHSLASAMQTAAEALDRGAAEANPALGQRLVRRPGGPYPAAGAAGGRPARAGALRRAAGCGSTPRTIDLGGPGARHARRVDARGAPARASACRCACPLGPLVVHGDHDPADAIARQPDRERAEIRRFGWLGAGRSRAAVGRALTSWR